MAQKVEILLLDDLDGTEATVTRHFSLEGASYEIDLSDRNAAKLSEVLAPFIDAARKTSTRGGGLRLHRGGKAVAGPSRDKDELLKVRQFWRETVEAGNPWDLAEFSTHGRIPRAVEDAYREHGHLPRKLTKG